MKNLIFNTQVCTTIELSKRLLELGLDADTSDILTFQLLIGVRMLILANIEKTNVNLK